MSDALNYLVAARPDAIGPYFKFLKEAGKNLDTRTRDLISVITKVDAQTETLFQIILTHAAPHHQACIQIEVSNCPNRGPFLGSHSRYAYFELGHTDSIELTGYSQFFFETEGDAG